MSAHELSESTIAAFMYMLPHKELKHRLTFSLQFVHTFNILPFLLFYLNKCACNLVCEHNPLEHTFTSGKFTQDEMCVPTFKKKVLHVLLFVTTCVIVTMNTSYDFSKMHDFTKKYLQLEKGENIHIWQGSCIFLFTSA